MIERAHVIFRFGINFEVWHVVPDPFFARSRSTRLAFALDPRACRLRRMTRGCNSTRRFAGQDQPQPG